MKKAGNRLAALALGLGILFLIAQIWAFSLESPTISGERSHTMAEQGLAMLGQMQVSASLFDRVEQWVRKSAHFLEFAALGFFVQWFWAAFRRLTPHNFFHGLFLGLLVAVADESLQILTQRVALVEDILIDFAGVLMGSCLALALFGLWKLATWKRWHGAG